MKQAIDRYIEQHNVDGATATRAVLAYAALAMVQHMPVKLIQGLFASAERALTGTTEADLEAVRVSAWHFLEEKHGTSVVVADEVDQAVRLLIAIAWDEDCLLYTSPSPRDQRGSRMPSSA